MKTLTGLLLNTSVHSMETFGPEGTTLQPCESFLLKTGPSLIPAGHTRIKRQITRETQSIPLPAKHIINGILTTGPSLIF